MFRATRIDINGFFFINGFTEVYLYWIKVHKVDEVRQMLAAPVVHNPVSLFVLV